MMTIEEILKNEVVKLSDARAEMKKEKGSINQALNVLLSFAEACPSVAAVTFSTDFAKSCASSIYEAMEIGKTYKVKVTKTNEDGTKTTEEVERVRKASADLCLRWFVNNQKANAAIFAQIATTQSEGEGLLKSAKEAEKEAKAQKRKEERDSKRAAKKAAKEAEKARKAAEKAAAKAAKDAAKAAK